MKPQQSRSDSFQAVASWGPQGRQRVGKARLGGRRPRRSLGASRPLAGLDASCLRLIVLAQPGAAMFSFLRCGSPYGFSGGLPWVRLPSVRLPWVSNLRRRGRAPRRTDLILGSARRDRSRGRLRQGPGRGGVLRADFVASGPENVWATGSRPSATCLIEGTDRAIEPLRSLYEFSGARPWERGIGKRDFVERIRPKMRSKPTDDRLENSDDAGEGGRTDGPADRAEEGRPLIPVGL